jgi:cell division protein FtsQ
MKKFKINIKRNVKITTGVLLVGFLIAFSERKQDNLTIMDVEVKLENINNNHFIDEADIIGLMGTDPEMLRGANPATIDLRQMENRIRNDRYISDAELYNDLKGNLVVKVKLRRPIARVVQIDGPDGYIADDGTVMPVSDKFTSRVVVISGAYGPQLLKMKNVNETEEGTEIMELLNVLQKDEFWRAQISQLDIDGKTRISIYPQVGDELIEFGKPTDIGIKFKKLKIYYKEILPRMGWNRYKRVNLEYAGQIVAE